MSRRTKIAAAALTSVLVVFAGGVLLAYFLEPPLYGRTEAKQHVAQVDWLPKDATDITYIKNEGGLFPWLCLECSMTPQVVQSFAEKKGWNLTERRNYSTGLRMVLKLPPVRQIDGQAIDLYPIALVYENRKGNGGGVTAIYDPERQRLFIHQGSN